MIFGARSLGAVLEGIDGLERATRRNRRARGRGAPPARALDAQLAGLTRAQAALAAVRSRADAAATRLLAATSQKRTTVVALQRRQGLTPARLEAESREAERAARRIEAPTTPVADTAPAAEPAAAPARRRDADARRRRRRLPPARQDGERAACGDRRDRRRPDRDPARNPGVRPRLRRRRSLRTWEPRSRATSSISGCRARPPRAPGAAGPSRSPSTVSARATRTPRDRGPGVRPDAGADHVVRRGHGPADAPHGARFAHRPSPWAAPGRSRSTRAPARCSTPTTRPVRSCPRRTRRFRSRGRRSRGSGPASASARRSSAPARAPGPPGDGDLFLKGHGDPTLRAQDVARLAAAVRRAGITRVTGWIRGDESVYDSRRDAPGWKPSFVGIETPPLSALVVERARGWGRQKAPPLVAARLLRAELVARGVRVAGPAGLGTAPDAVETLAVDHSAALRADRPRDEHGQRQLHRRDGRSSSSARSTAGTGRPPPARGS